MASPLRKRPSKSKSEDLPEISSAMVLDFFQRSSAPKKAERRAEQFLQEKHEKAVVGYACAEREGTECQLRATVYLEHEARQQCCTVLLSVDEEKRIITHVRCLSCAHGGCSHAIAMLRWTHEQGKKDRNKKSTCHWKQADVIHRLGVLTVVRPTGKISNRENLQNDQNLSNVTPGLKEKQAILPQVGKNKNCNLMTKTVKKKKGGETLQNDQNSSNVRPVLKEKQKCVEASKCSIESPKDILDLSLDQISLQCSARGIDTAEGFISFAASKSNKSLCRIIEQKTRQQSKSSIWFKLRYGRITASKIYEVSRCKVTNGNLVKNILGTSNNYTNYYMQRGIDLEDSIFEEVLKLGYKIDKCGFFLHADYPYLGASPDGIGNDFILEIKCPSSPETFKNYLCDGKITKKCKAQVLLQMLLTGKPRGLFCVADWRFESNRKIYIDWVDYDENEMYELVDAASRFWKANIYPRLMNSACMYY